MSETDRYADLLHMERPISQKHRPMERGKRAAQFAPFAALSGFEDRIADQRRIGDRFRNDEDRRESLDRWLTQLLASPNPPPIIVTHFLAGKRERDGRIVETVGVPKRVECGALLLGSGERIPFASIIDLKTAEE